MDTLSNIRYPRKFILVVSPDPAHAAITELIARLALHGSLYVLAGSDWLPVYQLAHLIRRSAPAVKQTLRHVRTARAFTCYQLLDLIANIRPDEEPLLLPDFLHSFQDDDIPLQVRFRVLRQCCDHLGRLAMRKTVVVFAQELPTENNMAFLSILAESADETLRCEAEPEWVRQPALL